MGGGIIINRRAALLNAAMDPSIYPYLSQTTKDAVECIARKAPGDTTQDDIETLAAAILEAVNG